MEIYKKELPDILKALPEINHFDETKEWDLIICTLGFEDITHTILDRLVAKGKTKHTSLLLIRYPTNEKDNTANEIFFVRAAEEMVGFHQITYSRKEYSDLLSRTLDAWYPLKRLKVLFDISSCSSYVFYPTINTLLDRNVLLTVGYTEAEIYYPTREEWSGVANHAQIEENLFVESFENATFQSLGVDDIYPLPLFSEMNPGNRQGVLIAVPNFSVMRMNAIRTRDRETNNTPFEAVYWIIGAPPGEQNQWRLEAIKTTNGLTDPSNVKVIHVSTFDYKDILKCLENIWHDNRYTSYLSVGPLGSKMQHVGTYIFLYLHRDVGLWLAEPREFRARRFSTGCASIWQIAFGDTIVLKALLDGYMTFTWKF